MGRPSRLELEQWDSVGYVHGWFVDQDGHRNAQLGSYPEVVVKLASALKDMAPHVNGWREALERRSAGLSSLVRDAREKAELNAVAKLEAQGWLRKLLFPTSLKRELRFLGFR